MKYLSKKSQLERKKNEPEILLSSALLIHKHQPNNDPVLQCSKGAAEI